MAKDGSIQGGSAGNWSLLRARECRIVDANAVEKADRPGCGLDRFEDAARSAFDEDYHPGQFELIEVGQQYMGDGKLGKLVGNVIANIESVRRRAEA